MKPFKAFDNRPLLVAIAGPNGAGKTTFFRSHLASSGLRFINVDVLARELNVNPYVAANMADTLRNELVRNRESFIFETVFSDPAGAKLSFLRDAVLAGYTVVLCFIGISNWKTSDERVAMRVSQGGHNVPVDKLRSRFPRTMANLKEAIRDLPHVLVYDNEDLRHPFRRVAVFENGKAHYRLKPPPRWFTGLG